MPKDRDKYYLLPSSRFEARRKNIKYYFSGEPCKRGHLSIRGSVSGSCYECTISNNLKNKYRTAKQPISEHTNQLINKQHNLCCICNIKLDEDFCVDHNHTTGLIRGILCRTCNIGLEQFKDNPILLEAAIAYLRQPETKLIHKKHRQVQLQ